MLEMARQFKRTELVSGFLACFAVIAIQENETRSRKLVEAALSNPEVYGDEMDGVARVLAEWHMPRDPRVTQPADKLERVFVLTRLLFDSAHKALQQLHQAQRTMPPDQRPNESAPWVKSIATQFNHFAMETRFSAKNRVKALTDKSLEECKKAADSWWQRVEPLFTQLERWLHPHLGDHLIDALAEWFPHDPARCLHWLRRLCEAGTQTNLLFERLIVGDVIKILQRCLAEHRDLLSSDKAFLQDFAAVLEAILATANDGALGMAASLDEFYR
jgi:hypothetical protein